MHELNLALADKTYLAKNPHVVIRRISGAHCTGIKAGNKSRHDKGIIWSSVASLDGPVARPASRPEVHEQCFGQLHGMAMACGRVGPLVRS